jgi:hypothetical protein
VSERKQAIPERDDRALRDMLDDARRRVAENRQRLSEMAREGQRI